jgi:hypothetical protein
MTDEGYPQRQTNQLPELPDEPNAAYLLGWDHGRDAGFAAGAGHVWDHFSDFLKLPDVQDVLKRGYLPGVVDRFASYYAEQRTAAKGAVTPPDVTVR